MGRYFFTYGSFPESDIYSYLSKNWHILHEWGSYLIFYAVHAIGDYVGLIVFKAAIWVGIFAAFAWYIFKHKLNVFLCNIILILTIVACSHRFTERSSLFSEVFFTLLLLWLVNLEGKVNKKIFFLPLIFLAWVNTHPGYVLGLLVLAWFVAHKIAQYFFDKERKVDFDGRIIYSALLSIFALLINPVFIEGALYPFRTVLKPSWALYKIFNYEWMPTFGSRFAGTFEVKFLVVLIFVSLFLLFRNLKIYSRNFIFYLTLNIGLVVLISFASRFMTTGALGLCILCLKYIKDKPIYFLVQWETLLLGVTNIILIFGIGYVLSSGYVSSSGLRKVGFGVDANVFPVEAVDFIQKNQLQGKFFNEYEWGGYLIWKLNRPDSIFIHGHIDDPNLLVYEYLAINSSVEKFSQTVQKYQINYFLLDRNKLLNPQALNLVIQLEKHKILFANENSVLVQVH